MSKKNIDFFCITKKVGNILTISTLIFIILFFSITKINSYDYEIDKIKNAVENRKIIIRNKKIKIKKKYIEFMYPSTLKLDLQFLDRKNENDNNNNNNSYIKTLFDSNEIYRNKNKIKDAYDILISSSLNYKMQGKKVLHVKINNKDYNLKVVGIIDDAERYIVLSNQMLKEIRKNVMESPYVVVFKKYCYLNKFKKNISDNDINDILLIEEKQDLNIDKLERAQFYYMIFFAIIIFFVFIYCYFYVKKILLNNYKKIEVLYYVGYSRRKLLYKLLKNFVELFIISVILSFLELMITIFILKYFISIFDILLILVSVTIFYFLMVVILTKKLLVNLGI